MSTVAAPLLTVFALILSGVTTGLLITQGTPRQRRVQHETLNIVYGLGLKPCHRENGRVAWLETSNSLSRVYGKTPDMTDKLEKLADLCNKLFFLPCEPIYDPRKRIHRRSRMQQIDDMLKDLGGKK